MGDQLHTSSDRIHAVGFYPADAGYAAAVSTFVLDAIERGGAAVLISTQQHRSEVATELSRSGLDVAEAQRAGTLVVLDADETLARIAPGAVVDADAFDDVVGGVVRRLSREHDPVAAYGEMVSLLWDAGDVMAAFELEELWNNLLEQETFALFCSYSAMIRDAAANADVTRLHELHSHIVHESFTPWQTMKVRLRREVAATFRGDVDSIADARRFAVDTVTRWGHAERTDEVALVASELVTNAVVHAETDVTVRVSSDGATIKVAVEDGQPTTPMMVTAPDDRVSGRGLFLVDAVVKRWGAEPVDGNGKAVWAELDVAGARTA